MFIEFSFGRTEFADLLLLRMPEAAGYGQCNGSFELGHKSNEISDEFGCCVMARKLVEYPKALHIFRHCHAARKRRRCALSRN
jgi:hypothetical protein